MLYKILFISLYFHSLSGSMTIIKYFWKIFELFQYKHVDIRFLDIQFWGVENGIQ